jgi:hypothetical protein
MSGLNSLLNLTYTFCKQKGLCTQNVTLRRVRATIVAVEKQCLLHIPSVCVCVFVALGTRRDMSMHHIVYSLSGSIIFFHFIL